jgi:hypothetical protein
MDQSRPGLAKTRPRTIGTTSAVARRWKQPSRNRAGISGRYRQSSPGRPRPRQQPRPVTRQRADPGTRRLAPARSNADRHGPSSSRAPRTHGWRPPPAAPRLPSRAASGRPAAVRSFVISIEIAPAGGILWAVRRSGLLTQGKDSELAGQRLPRVPPSDCTTAPGGGAFLCLPDRAA